MNLKFVWSVQSNITEHTSIGHGIKGVNFGIKEKVIVKKQPDCSRMTSICSQAMNYWSGYFWQVKNEQAHWDYILKNSSNKMIRSTIKSNGSHAKTRLVPLGPTFARTGNSLSGLQVFDDLVKNSLSNF